MPDPTWRAAFARLSPLKLTFAGCITPRCPRLQTLLAFPKTTISPNHVGDSIGPYKGKGAETFAQWKWSSATHYKTCPPPQCRPSRKPERAKIDIFSAPC